MSSSSWEYLKICTIRFVSCGEFHVCEHCFFIYWQKNWYAINSLRNAWFLLWSSMFVANYTNQENIRLQSINIYMYHLPKYIIWIKGG